jgi:Lrp/AsnC family transcriptional regulator for asnA, asnC and gidA
MKPIDQTDKKILSYLLKDGKISNTVLASKLNLSPVAVFKRINKLKEAGIIKSTQIEIDLKKLGYNTCAFIGIQIALTGKNSHSKVFEAIKKIPEVIESHHVSGKYSLFIKVIAKDNEDLKNIIVNKIQSIEGVVGTETFISLERGFVRTVDVNI